jgi:hypothetical protein
MYTRYEHLETRDQQENLDVDRRIILKRILEKRNGSNIYQSGTGWVLVTAFYKDANEPAGNVLGGSITVRLKNCINIRDIAMCSPLKVNCLLRVGFLLGFFESEKGGDIFLRNIG